VVLCEDKKEERFYSSHTGHRSKANPQRVSLSLYLHHFYNREKRVEQPHLLVGFSPVLGFPGHILCSFVDGVFIYLCSLFFAFKLIQNWIQELDGAQKGLKIKVLRMASK
jgi:hypothetical protein